MTASFSLLHNFSHQFQDQAEKITILASETLFQEGDRAQYAYVRVIGRCMLSRHAEPLGEASATDILDELAVLGGLAHTQRAITLTDCEFLRWQIDDLWRDATFSKIARQYLVTHLQQSQSRLDQLQAPVHYRPDTAQVQAGPYVFPNSTIIFVFCTAPKMDFPLPQGVSRIGNRLLIGIADFQNAYYHHNPDARFSYTETTFFVPVRVGLSLGLYVPYIYPSAYEPIVLGREIYGFPKQLGETRLSDSQASLAISGEDTFRFTIGKHDKSSEPRIVGAFGQLFGVTGRITSAAFAIGDSLLSMMNVPFYRRVSVFNHKRIPSATTTRDKPTYDVDMLTQAIFSVEHWQKIDHLPNAKLQVTGGIFKQWDITLYDAFYTELSMRLSTGRITRDYRVS
ncbi:MAG: acetoacetate decarboxylase family protein [Anaerolineae bacterium]|nr:acetoacetate decarboxylase family protein [Anaerolineae bacterium]